jgi:hypothetical protein
MRVFVFVLQVDHLDRGIGSLGSGTGALCSPLRKTTAAFSRCGFVGDSLHMPWMYLVSIEPETHVSDAPFLSRTVSLFQPLTLAETNMYIARAIKRLEPDADMQVDAAVAVRWGAVMCGVGCRYTHAVGSRSSLTPTTGLSPRIKCVDLHTRSHTPAGASLPPVRGQPCPAGRSRRAATSQSSTQRRPPPIHQCTEMNLARVCVCVCVCVCV